MSQQQFEPWLATESQDAGAHLGSAGHAMSPRPFDRVGHMLTVWRSKAHADAEIREFWMWVMPAVEFGNRLGIALAGLRLDQNAFLKMRLEQALECHEKRRAVMAMPICVASWHNLSIVNLHLHLRIARQRAIKCVEQKIAVKTCTGRHD